MPKIKFPAKLKGMTKKKHLFLMIVLGVFITGLLILLWWGITHPHELGIILPNSSNFQENLSSQKSINLLFLGVAGNGSRGALLTDTIIIVNIDFDKKQAAVFSLPRDLWIQIPNSSNKIKLNALYLFNNNNKSDFSKAKSFNLVQEKIEEITGLKINYVTIFDLVGFGKLVDAVGGINIYLSQEMIDPNLVNPHNTSEIFDLSPGWHYLDGATAIKFVRTRYSPNGDFYRMNNQHLVIAALRDKIIQLSNVWNLMAWLKIYNSMNNHYISNLDFNTLWELFNSFKNIKTGQIKYFSITNRPPDNLLISSSVPGVYENATTSVFILLPRAGFENYDEIKQFIYDSLNK